MTPPETAQQPPRKMLGGALGGAVAGVALVALVALGWWFASGEPAADAEPGAPRREVATASAAPRSQESPHGTETSSTFDLEVERLRGELEAAPDRLDLRKKLALRLLSQGQFYPAFEEANRILELAPDDIDGLFINGAVRTRMGQPSKALPLLDRVLEQFPDHVPALTAKGRALLKAGHPDLAAEVWHRALELSGGSNRQIEDLLQSIAPSASATS